MCERAGKAVVLTITSLYNLVSRSVQYLLYLHGESLLNAAHVYCWERLLTAGRGLFGHQDGNVIHGGEIGVERAVTDSQTTAVASHKNCSDDETTSLGTMENYSLPQTFREQPDFL